MTALWYDYSKGSLSAMSGKAYSTVTDHTGAIWQQYSLLQDAFGNTTAIQVSARPDDQTDYSSPITLASYAYESDVNNGRMSSMTYANGDSVDYAYDLFDRVTRETYNNADTEYQYEYDAAPIQMLIILVAYNLQSRTGLRRLHNFLKDMIME